MASIRQFLARLAYGIRHPEEEVTRAQKLVADSYFFARYCASRLRRHRAPQLASALSYRTIFSIIPLLALSLVMVRGIYGEEGIRRGLRAVMDFTGISDLAIVTNDVEAIEGADGAAAGAAGSQQRSGTAQAAADKEAGEATGPASDAVTLVPAITSPLMLNSKTPLTSFVLTNQAWLAQQQQAAESRSSPAGAETEPGQAVADWIERFVDNLVSRLSDINLRWITLVAVGVFIYAAISLLIQVEDAFNAVCNARSGRPIISRITNYWTMLTLGSLVLVASFVVGEAYARLLSQVPEWLDFVRTPVSIATKIGASWLLLLFAYSQMPNTRVKLKFAAIGAIVAAVLWELGKAGLGWFIRDMTGGQVAVYGSLALLPLFLLWVYVTWLIVLFGLELAHATQTVGPERREQMLRGADVPIIDPTVGIAVLRVIAMRFERGATTTPSDVAEGLGIPEHTTQRIIQRLTDAGVLLHAMSGAEDEGITLARPAERMQLRTIAERVFPLTLAGGVQEGIEAIRRAQLDALGERTLADLLERSAERSTDSTSSTDAEPEAQAAEESARSRRVGTLSSGGSPTGTKPSGLKKPGSTDSVHR